MTHNIMGFYHVTDETLYHVTDHVINIFHYEWIFTLHNHNPNTAGPLSIMKKWNKRHCDKRRFIILTSSSYRVWAIIGTQSGKLCTCCLCGRRRRGFGDALYRTRGATRTQCAQSKPSQTLHPISMFLANWALFIVRMRCHRSGEGRMERLQR